MSRKSVLEPYLVISAGDMSADITSEETTVKNLDRYSYELSWTGTSPVGAITVEILVKNAWETLPTDAMAVSGNTGNITVSITDITWTKTRLKYAFTSGTGTLTAYINGAVTGA